MTVLIYVNTSKQVGDPDYLKVFANQDAAETWFEENVPRALRLSMRSWSERGRELRRALFFWGGHRKMSRADHDEPLRWHWLYIPLVAFLVFTVGPSVLVTILLMLSLVVVIAGIAVPVPQHLLSILIDPFFIGLALWPFSGCIVTLGTH